MSVSHCIRFGSCLSAVALLLPGATGSMNRSCALGPPTAQSYTWNFPREAQGLLKEVVSEAREVRQNADTLQRMTTDPDIDWEPQAMELNQIRGAINEMGTRLCRLESIRRVASPWEQKAIDADAPLIAEMANEAQAAITYLNDNHHDLFNPTYRDYAAGLYQRSSRLAGNGAEFDNFGKIHQEDIRLEKSLGLIKGS